MKCILSFGTMAMLILGVYGESTPWWQNMSLYQIYPRSFKDNDGDGIGDLQGIKSKLEYLRDSGIEAFWLSPIYPSPMVDFGYDISDFKDIDPIFGTMQDFDELLAATHKLGLRLIMDLVPNHSSDEHEWFKKSVKKIEPYTDYYTWNPGKIVDDKRVPPNNWASVFYGPAWTWNEERQEYYLHQFAPQQPDLNYRNEYVVEEIKEVMRFWLRKGVDGFRVDAIPFLFEDKDLPDEPPTGDTDDPLSYSYAEHIYTTSQPETYDMVHQWSRVLAEFDNDRVMMMEAYASLEDTMRYYDVGASFPFNFGFISALNNDSKASDFEKIIDTWMKNMPPGAVANWVAGNHDNQRIASRFGRDLAPAVQAMVQLLPGVSVTYNGDEIGMVDAWLTWEQTRDPQGCNAGPDGYAAVSRDPERTPFQWDDSVSAGFSSNPNTWLPVNENYKTLNLAAQKASEKSYYKTFLKIMNLRKWPAVKSGSLSVQSFNDDNILVFSRTLEGKTSIYVVTNFGQQSELVDLNSFVSKPTKLKLYLSTVDIPDTVSTININTDPLKIPPRSCSIYESTD